MATLIRSIASILANMCRVFWIGVLLLTTVILISRDKNLYTIRKGGEKLETKAYPKGKKAVKKVKKTRKVRFEKPMRYL